MTMPTFRKASDIPPDANGDKAPRRGRPPGSGSGKRRSSRSLRAGIDGLLVVINTVIGTVRPVDALDGTELAVLGKAIDEQAKASPRFRKGLEAILNVTGGTSLLPVLIIIGGRRLSRHNVIPAPVDPLGRVVLQMMQAEPSAAAEAMDGIMSAFNNARSGNDDGTDTATAES